MVGANQARGLDRPLVLLGLLAIQVLRRLSRFWRPIQRMRTVIRSGELIRGWDHGGQITCCGGRGAKARVAGAEPVARSRRGGSVAGDPAHITGLDQPGDRRCVWREDTVRLWRSA